MKTATTSKTTTSNSTPVHNCGLMVGGRGAAARQQKTIKRVEHQNTKLKSLYKVKKSQASIKSSTLTIRYTRYSTCSSIVNGCNLRSAKPGEQGAEESITRPRMFYCRSSVGVSDVSWVLYQIDYTHTTAKHQSDITLRKEKEFLVHNNSFRVRDYLLEVKD